MRLFCPTCQILFGKSEWPRRAKFCNDSYGAWGRFRGFVSARLRGQIFSPARALQHLLDMGDRRLRLDAVAEIEDEAALRKIRQHIVDRAVER